MHQIAQSLLTLFGTMTQTSTCAGEDTCAINWGYLCYGERAQFEIRPGLILFLSMVVGDFD